MTQDQYNRMRNLQSMEYDPLDEGLKLTVEETMEMGDLMVLHMQDVAKDIKWEWTE